MLLDGNIGIGGDPEVLLSRVSDILAPEGTLLTEAAPTEVEERVEVRLDDGNGGSGPVFPWARIGAPALRKRAQAAGWEVLEEWAFYERYFFNLRPPRDEGGRSAYRTARDS